MNNLSSLFTRLNQNPVSNTTITENVTNININQNNNIIRNSNNNTTLSDNNSTSLFGSNPITRNNLLANINQNPILNDNNSSRLFSNIEHRTHIVQTSLFGDEIGNRNENRVERSGAIFSNNLNNPFSPQVSINNNSTNSLFSVRPINRDNLIIDHAHNSNNRLRPQQQQQRIMGPFSSIFTMGPEIRNSLTNSNIYLHDSLIVYKITGALAAWALLNQIPFGISFSKIIY